MIWNPAPHAKHAWSDAKTMWGKSALILFYLLIWSNIIICTIGLFKPGIMGSQCYFDMVQDNPEAEAMLIAGTRAYFVFVIGFFSYADVGGLQVKNVTMVTIFVILSVIVMLPLLSYRNDDNACIQGTIWQYFLCPIWVILTLIFTILEDKLGDHGTEEERQNLSV